MSESNVRQLEIRWIKQLDDKTFYVALTTADGAGIAFEGTFHDTGILWKDTQEFVMTLNVEGYGSESSNVPY